MQGPSNAAKAKKAVAANAAQPITDGPAQKAIAPNTAPPISTTALDSRFMVYPFTVIDNARLYPFFGLCKLFLYMGNRGVILGTNLGKGKKGVNHRRIGNIGNLVLLV